VFGLLAGDYADAVTENILYHLMAS